MKRVYAIDVSASTSSRAEYPKFVEKQLRELKEYDEIIVWGQSAKKIPWVFPMRWKKCQGHVSELGTNFEPVGCLLPINQSYELVVITDGEINLNMERWTNSFQDEKNRPENLKLYLLGNRRNICDEITYNTWKDQKMLRSWEYVNKEAKIEVKSSETLNPYLKLTDEEIRKRIMQNKILEHTFRNHIAYDSSEAVRVLNKLIARGRPPVPRFEGSELIEKHRNGDAAGARALINSQKKQACAYERQEYDKIATRLQEACKRSQRLSSQTIAELGSATPRAALPKLEDEEGHIEALDEHGEEFCDPVNLVEIPQNVEVAVLVHVGPGITQGDITTSVTRKPGKLWNLPDEETYKFRESIEFAPYWPSTTASLEKGGKLTSPITRQTCEFIIIGSSDAVIMHNAYVIAGMLSGSTVTRTLGSLQSQRMLVFSFYVRMLGDKHPISTKVPDQLENALIKLSEKIRLPVLSRNHAAINYEIPLDTWLWLHLIGVLPMDRHASIDCYHTASLICGLPYTYQEWGEQLLDELLTYWLKNSSFWSAVNKLIAVYSNLTNVLHVDDCPRHDDCKCPTIQIANSLGTKKKIPNIIDHYPFYEIAEHFRKIASDLWFKDNTKTIPDCLKTPFSSDEDAMEALRGPTPLCIHSQEYVKILEEIYLKHLKVDSSGRHSEICHITGLQWRECADTLDKEFPDPCGTKWPKVFGQLVRELKRQPSVNELALAAAKDHGQEVLCSHFMLRISYIYEGLVELYTPLSTKKQK